MVEIFDKKTRQHFKCNLRNGQSNNLHSTAIQQRYKIIPYRKSTIHLIVYLEFWHNDDTTHSPTCPEIRWTSSKRRRKMPLYNVLFELQMEISKLVNIYARNEDDFLTNRNKHITKTRHWDSCPNWSIIANSRNNVASSSKYDKSKLKA